MEAKKAKTSLQTQSRMGGSRSRRVACLAEKRRAFNVIEIQSIVNGIKLKIALNAIFGRCKLNAINYIN